MFHHVSGASKVALVCLAARLRKRGFQLLDTQWITPHLAQFGAISIPRREYLHLLQVAIRVTPRGSAMKRLFFRNFCLFAGSRPDKSRPDTGQTMKIYTRSGDDGSTSLFSGERVSKTSLRVEACGTLDELNCAIGATRAASPTAATENYLATIQHHLFSLGADLATSAEKQRAARIKPVEIEWLETEIDRMETELPPLRNFILPGGTRRPPKSTLHAPSAA